VQGLWRLQKRSAKPADQPSRNDMYVTSEALRLMLKADNPKFNPDEKAALNKLTIQSRQGHQIIPAWVKVL